MNKKEETENFTSRIKLIMPLSCQYYIHNKFVAPVNPHAEEVKSLASNPDVNHHAAPENINPKLEPSDKPSQPTKLPGIVTFIGNSGLGGTNPLLF